MSSDSDKADKKAAEVSKGEVDTAEGEEEVLLSLKVDSSNQDAENADAETEDSTPSSGSDADKEDEEVSPPEEVSGSSTSSSSSFGRFFVTVLAMLIAGAIGGASAWWVFERNQETLPIVDVKEDRVDVTPLFEAVDLRIADLAKDVESAQSQIETLSDAQSAARAEPIEMPDLEPLEEEVQTLRDRVAGLEQAVSIMQSSAPVAAPDSAEGQSFVGIDPKIVTQLRNDMTQLQGVVRRLQSDLNSRMTALESIVPPENLNQVLGGLAPQSAVAQLDLRIQELERNSNSDQAKQATLALTLANLARAVQSGQPFGSELEAVAILAPGQQGLASLRDFSASGIPRQDQLIEQFVPLSRQAFKEQWKASSQTWWDKIVSSLRGLITIRRTGDVPGDDIEAVIARTEQALEDGNLRVAAGEARQLTGPGAEILSDWLRHVEAHNQADDVVKALSARVLSNLGQSEGE